jgi:hypothetical protein
MTTVPHPAGASSSELWGVSCPSNTSCVAVGNKTTGAGVRALGMRWSPTGWALTTVPFPAGAATTSLSGVSCTSTSWCTAVGNTGQVPCQACATVYTTLVERWDGQAWARTQSPNPSGVTELGLNAVDCKTSTDCVAVGTKALNGTFRPLILKKTAAGWSIAGVSGPQGYAHAPLTGVSCQRTTSTCFAVGFKFGPGVGRTYVMRRSGTTWASTESPNTSTTATNRLDGVYCQAGAACFAVGLQNPSARNATLALRFS